jgi:hypothetical protein
MKHRDPRIDAYIRKSAPFAQPILTHLRAVVHEACPDVEETMKWSFPHFDYKGIFCSMAAFKAHAAFAFWKGPLLAGMLPNVEQTAMGQFGRITSIADLPARKTLIRIVRAAAKLNDEGIKIERPGRPETAPLRPPADLLAALAANAKAAAAFKAFSPSQKREYVEWISEARQPATREKRLATAIDWLSQGKPRNWKYMK